MLVKEIYFDYLINFIAVSFISGSFGLFSIKFRAKKLFFEA